MPKDEKILDTVAKLIELTQDGKLRWEARAPIDEMKEYPDERMQTVFTTLYKDKRLRLYKRIYRVVTYEAPWWGFVGTSYERRFKEESWHSQTTLEILDSSGLKLWTFPQMSALDDLLESVQYQAAEVKAYLEEILSDNT
jgi:hypothetical protein